MMNSASLKTSGHPLEDGINHPEQRQPERRPRTRARVACKRCRRIRKQCLHDNGQAPCTGCYNAGPETARDCRFPSRGEPDEDRVFRQRKPATEQPPTTTSTGSLSKTGSVSNYATIASTVDNRAHNDPQKQPFEADRWSLLPPYEEVVDACKVFSTSFFQLGFIPKAIFLERLANDRASINVFFLLAILSISARLTPSIISRFEDGIVAAETFMARAQRLVPQEMYMPTLERTQAFFLLAISELRKGDKTSSNIHMGIAVQMAGLLHLHREEAYAVTTTSTAEEIQNSESARRTFWMLKSQDNLHAGYTTPVSFFLGDITTLLPCEERDFAFGLIPHERAALAGTLAATRSVGIVHTPSRSLFATLIQAHNLWGQVARHAVSTSELHAGQYLQPWDARSDYATLSNTLRTWEDHLPSRHRWSIWNFRGYKSEGVDLAYLSVVMVLRLSNIILRRRFIENIIVKENNNESPPDFWRTVSTELFENVLGLHEQIDAFLTLRSPEQGFPALIAFCVYACGSLANHLWRMPEICPKLAPKAGDIVSKSLEVLSGLEHVWPLAKRWRQVLEERASAIREERRTKPSKYPELLESSSPSAVRYNTGPTDVPVASGGHPLNTVTDGQRVGMPDLSYPNILQPTTYPMYWDHQQYLTTGYYAGNSPTDDMEAQLADFLQVQGQLGMLYE
ncbi:hypothetical protein BJ878DRAFT_232489 [Calycina marina]|uniref:Xylanolytic transcriptional activator regulatory domain-containing protein n=1 Tax=Calycina marina TaxID=1763456 RepID=A0A9P7Z8D4_9HELO|nr:hypothetical protein BJ878DRAFT_232489 [Calycina marina]